MTTTVFQKNIHLYYLIHIKNILQHNYKLEHLKIFKNRF